MKHIRPPVRLYAPRCRLVGNGTVNSGTVTYRFNADLGSPERVLQGNAIAHIAPLIITGFGALSQKRAQIVGNTFTRRSKGSGALAQKKSLLSGTAIRIVAAAASVPLYNALGQPTGAYGPSNDSIFPSVAFAQGVVWWPSNLPAGMTMVPRPGGSMDWSTSGVAPGTYPITINILFPVGNRFVLTPSPTVTVT